MKCKNEFKAEVDNYAVEIGFKAANQVMLFKKDIPVPPILPLTHQLCSEHLSQYSPHWQVLWEQFKKIQADNRTELASGTHEVLKELRTLIKDTFVKHPLSEHVVNAYLKEHVQSDDLLMVRSTGMEDSEELANPGGNKSYSGIKPDIEVISKATGRVIASYFGEKSLEQRLKSGKNLQKEDFVPLAKTAFMPVLLQKMIKGTVYSGVMYTSERGTHIQVAPGHGELVVNSKGLVDSYFVTRNTVIHSQIYEKDIRIELGEGTNNGELVVVQNSQGLREQPSLSPEVVKRLVEMGKQVSAFYGAARDIEFVYDAKTDELFLVQARPIPQGKLDNVIPRAISPQKIKFVRKQAKAENRLIINAKTISPGGNRAAEITKPDELLVSNAIKEALDKVLFKMKADEIEALKVVIVTTDAPPTSHEAAQFNALGKAVLVVSKNEANGIEKLVNQKKDNLNLIIDPQRKLIVDWTGKELEGDILEDGLFKSSMLAERSILKSKNTIEDIDEAELALMFEEVIAPAKDHNLSEEADNRKVGLYDCLLSLLEDIEGVDTSIEKINTAKKALGLILKSFEGLARPNPLDSEAISQRKTALYRQACIYVLDINQCLNGINQESPIENHQLLPEVQHELLDLVNGLEALLSNPGRNKLFSDSLYQLGFEKKAERELINIYEKQFSQLPNDEVRNSVIQFYRFGQGAINQNLRDKWTQFILGVAKYGHPPKNQNFEKLLHIVNFSAKNELGGVLINTVFYRGGTVKSMFDMVVNSQKLLDSHEFWKLTAKVTEWETKISLWEKEKNYDKLIADFEKDTDELLDRLEQMGDLNKLPICVIGKVKAEIARLDDVIDLSIKTMQGSRDYKDEQIKAEKFARIINPAHKLMEYAVRQIPDALTNRGGYTKELKLKEIRKGFEKRKEEIEPADFTFSWNYYIDAALITSSASFYYTFVNFSQYLTLAHYHSLFHQNILASLSLIGKDLNLPVELFPDFLHSFHQKLIEMPNISLISTESKGNLIFLVYNVPLQDHSLQLHLIFDKNNNKLEVQPKIFGINRGGRVAKSADFINLFFNDFINEFFEYNFNTRTPGVILNNPATAHSYDGEKLKLKDQGIMGVLQANFTMDSTQFNEEHALFIAMLNVICEVLNPNGFGPQLERHLKDISFLNRHGNTAKKIALLKARADLYKDYRGYYRCFLNLFQTESSPQEQDRNTPISPGADTSSLMLAAETGDLAAVKNILAQENGDKEVLKLNKWGDSPFELAAWNDHLDVVDLLYPFVAPEILKRTLDVAIAVGDVALIKLMIAKGMMIDSDLLKGAIFRNNVDVLSILLNAKNIDNILFYSEGSWATSPFIFAMKEKYISSLQLLLDSLPDINANCPSRPSATPLMLAIEKKNIFVVEMLLNSKEKYNLQIDKTNDQGQSALITAVQHGLVDIVKLLLTHGADANLKDNYGATAVDYALAQGNMGVIDLFEIPHREKDGLKSSLVIKKYDFLLGLKNDLDSKIPKSSYSFYGRQYSVKQTNIEKLATLIEKLPKDDQEVTKKNEGTVNTLFYDVYQLLLNSKNIDDKEMYAQRVNVKEFCERYFLGAKDIINSYKSSSEYTP